MHGNGAELENAFESKARSVFAREHASVLRFAECYSLFASRWLGMIALQGLQ